MLMIENTGQLVKAYNRDVPVLPGYALPVEV